MKLSPPSGGRATTAKCFAKETVRFDRVRGIGVSWMGGPSSTNGGIGTEWICVGVLYGEVYLRSVLEGLVARSSVRFVGADRVATVAIPDAFAITGSFMLTRLRRGAVLSLSSSFWASSTPQHFLAQALKHAPMTGKSNIHLKEQHAQHAIFSFCLPSRFVPFVKSDPQS